MAQNTIFLLVWDIIGYHLLVYCGMSYAIVIKPTKQGQAKQIRLPWLDKPSKRQPSPVKPSMPSLMDPRSCPKAKKTTKKNLSNHGHHWLGVPWLLRFVFFAFFCFFAFGQFQGGHPSSLTKGSLS